MIRKMFQSPSIHFALVCGAKGCPILRKEPYTAARLEEQFAEQAQAFLRMKKRTSWTWVGKELHLAHIQMVQRRFREERCRNHSICGRLFPPKIAEALRGGGFRSTTPNMTGARTRRNDLLQNDEADTSPFRLRP